MSTMNSDELLARLGQGVQMAHLTYIVFTAKQLEAVTSSASSAGCVYSVLEDGLRRRPPGSDITAHEVWVNGSPEELAEFARRVALVMPDGR